MSELHQRRQTQNAQKEQMPAQQQSQRTQRSNGIIYLIFVSLLFDLLAFTIILPLLPKLLEYFREHDSSGLYAQLLQRIHWFQHLVGAPERFTSVFFGGLLGSLFSFLQFIVSPIVGGLSDHYGRKPVLLICSVGIALSYLLWALSHNFAIFVLARIIGGISKSNISLNMSIITDVSSEKERGKGMALVGVAFSLGFIFGPSIGAVFTLLQKQIGPWFVLPSLIALALSICNLLIIAFGLPETLPANKRSNKVTASLASAAQFVNVASIFKFSAIKNVPQQHTLLLRRIGLIYFLYLFLYSGLEFTVTFLMYHKFSCTAMDQARMFLTTGLVMALLQGSVVRRLPNTSTQKYAVYSLYLIVPAFILVGIAESLAVLYAGMILFAISTAFAVTCLTTLTSKYGNDNQKGAVLGIFRSLGALARALGPFVGSLAFWSFGSKLTYVFGGILLIIPALLLQRTRI